MVGGHVQYAKGYVESTIGNATGSAEWKESGERDMGEGVGVMKVCFYPLHTTKNKLQQDTCYMYTCIYTSND